MPKLIELTDEQQAEVRKLWAEGLLRDEIARRVGLTVDEFNAVRKRLELPDRPRVGSRAHVPPPPTQREIRSLCRQIRQGWTPEEYALRAGHPPLESDEREGMRRIRIIPISAIVDEWDQ